MDGKARLGTIFSQRGFCFLHLARRWMRLWAGRPQPSSMCQSIPSGDLWSWSDEKLLPCQNPKLRTSRPSINIQLCSAPNSQTPQLDHKPHLRDSQLLLYPYAHYENPLEVVHWGRKVKFNLRNWFLLPLTLGCLKLLWNYSSYLIYYITWYIISLYIYIFNFK